MREVCVHVESVHTLVYRTVLVLLLVYLRGTPAWLALLVALVARMRGIRA